MSRTFGAVGQRGGMQVRPSTGGTANGTSPLHAAAHNGQGSFFFDPAKPFSWIPQSMSPPASEYLWPLFGVLLLFCCCYCCCCSTRKYYYVVASDPAMPPSPRIPCAVSLLTSKYFWPMFFLSLPLFFFSPPPTRHGVRGGEPNEVVKCCPLSNAPWRLSGDVDPRRCPPPPPRNRSHQPMGTIRL